MTTITIDKDLRNDIMLFKIRTNAKNVREVLRLAIKKLREEENSIQMKGGKKPHGREMD